MTVGFDFYDGHDLYISRDTGGLETIKRDLRERMKNAQASGIARLSQELPAQDSIQLIASSFMRTSRPEVVRDELRIVVAPSTYEQANRLEIQVFLISLRPS